MVTGKTRDNILISGRYCCQDHPTVESEFVINDTFPHCHLQNHETIWELKEQQAKKNPDPSNPDTSPDGNGTQPGGAATLTNNPPPPETTLDDLIYRKKGFYAAMHLKNNPELVEYKLDEVVNSERFLAQKRIDDLQEIHTERLTIIREEFDCLKNQLDEKTAIKGEFSEELDKMEEECEAIRSEITAHYTDLKQEIKQLGTSKEDLISKRLEKFDSEITKLTEIYQNLERKQNEKHKQDFENRSIQNSDRQFYYDCREKLQESLNNVQIRIKTLEREGLNNTISKFLIFLGWIAAFTCSWFFEMWFGDPQGSSNLVVYILDNLRNFALTNGWLITSITFLGYIAVIMLISRFCYAHLLKAKFITGKDDKKDKNKEEDTIEFNPENDGLLKSQFKATTWYELWLKIAPFIAMVFLLVVILAIGSSNNPEKNTYKGLSESLSLQTIGFLTPFAFTAIIFLYILKVVEARSLRPTASTGTKPNTPALEETNSNSWEIKLVVVLFIALIGFLIAYSYIRTADLKSNLGAWGFFTGCLCTGLALAYGYRYLSLSESFDVLVDRIDNVNKYIIRAFYPFEVTYLKDGGILYRTKMLHHSLVDLMASRNYLAARLLNPHYKSQNKEQQKPEENKYPGDPGANDNAEQANDKKSANKNEKENPIKHLFKGVMEWIKKQELAWKKQIKDKDAKIKELEKELDDLKNDMVDIDELTYFPEVGAKINELKSLIAERTKRLKELTEELDGYFRNEKTYASLNQQIENINIKKQELAQKIQEERTAHVNNEKKIKETFTRIKLLIEEGYKVGLFAAQRPENENQ